jgi:Flp pilus assembly protein TadG
MIDRTDEKQNANVTGGEAAPQLVGSRISRGQSTVEFALLSTLAMVILLVGVQFALIGQADLALSQGSSVLARYAAVNQGALGTYNGTASLTPAEKALLSSTLLNNGGNLTVTIHSYQGGTANTTTNTPKATVDRVVINMTYSTAGVMALPNPFLGLISFPTGLSGSDSELYE